MCVSVVNSFEGEGEFCRIVEIAMGLGKCAMFAILSAIEVELKAWRRGWFDRRAAVCRLGTIAMSVRVESVIGRGREWWEVEV